MISMAQHATELDFTPKTLKPVETDFQTGIISKST